MKTPLYEKPSTGDGKKEGTMSRIMSRSKVVDLSTMSKEEQVEAMKQHAGGGKAEPKEPSKQRPVALSDPASAFSGLGSGFLAGRSLAGDESGSSAGRGSKDAIFETLVAGIDPDFAHASQVNARTKRSA